MQIGLVWHLHTKLQGPGEQFGRIALVQGMKGISCLVAAPIFTPSKPHLPVAAMGLCLPSSWPGISTATPWQAEKPAGLPQDPSSPSDHLLLSLHTLQTPLMT